MKYQRVTREFPTGQPRKKARKNETAAPAGTRNGGGNQKLSKTSTRKISAPEQDPQGFRLVACHGEPRRAHCGGPRHECP